MHPKSSPSSPGYPDLAGLRRSSRTTVRTGRTTRPRLLGCTRLRMVQIWPTEPGWADTAHPDRRDFVIKERRGESVAKSCASPKKCVTRSVWPNPSKGSWEEHFGIPVELRRLVLLHIEQGLGEAECHITQSENLIALQRARIDYLTQKGLPSSQSEALLEHFKQSLLLHIAVRDPLYKGNSKSARLFTALFCRHGKG